MAQNEKTSKSVASIASKIMNMKNPYIITNDLWEQIKSIAASVLTQTADNEKKPLSTDYFASKLKNHPLNNKKISDVKLARQISKSLADGFGK